MKMLGPILLTAHNLTYYQRLLARAREAIANNRFAHSTRRRKSAAGPPSRWTPKRPDPKD